MPVRIYQLAKELGVESKLLIERCQAEGYEVKSHMSSLEDDAAGRIRTLFAPIAKPKKPKPKPPPPPAPEKKAPPAEKEPAPQAPPAEAKPPAAEPIPLVPRAAGVVADQYLSQETIVRQRIAPRVPRRGRPRFRRKVRRREFRRPGPLKTEVQVAYPVTVKDLSSEIGLKASDILKALVAKGLMISITDPIPHDVIPTISEALGVAIKIKESVNLEQEVLQSFERESEENLKPRAPVVTFLGHVDHGKTSLLDAIRSSNVVASESGGITQHIGAYKVKGDGKEVVFLDTPGHEAFTAMRARGTNVTDLVVLVVAADDGVMAQTDEAIAHAKAADVPIVVAVNKMDRPDANINRVKQQLAERGLTPEDWGGKTIFVPTSALTKQGIDNLLEMLALEAELLELKADPQRPARGTVIEAEVTGSKGIVAHLLVMDGTLHRGDIILCGSGFGKIRAMFDDRGRPIRDAGPATPIGITGLSSLPEAGDKFYVVDDIQKARTIAAQREQRTRQKELTRREHVSLETIFAQLKEGQAKELRIIIKADVQGSVEVLRSSLEKLSAEEVKLHILYAAVGGISQSDVLLADASDAIIIGFHVMPNPRARRDAEERGVEIRLYQVIYDITNDIHAALEGMLAPKEVEVREGRLTVKQTFKISRIGTIAGCYVEEGTVTNRSRMRVVREGIIIYDGRIGTLRRFKDDVREVSQGFECGVKIADFDDLKEGDELISYRIESVARKLPS